MLQRKAESNFASEHPERARQRAISRAIFERFSDSPSAVRHSVQVTSFGGSGTTALCDHLAAAGIDLPATPGLYPFKHQRVPPASDAVPAGFRAVYLLGDPRDAVVSVFRRGFQDGHFVGMRGELPAPEAEAGLATLSTFLDRGIDEFEIEDHVDHWLTAHDRTYPILVVRFEALQQSWSAIRDFVGLPPSDRGLPPVVRSSDWRELPRGLRKQIDRMYGRLAERIERLPLVSRVGVSSSEPNVRSVTRPGAADRVQTPDHFSVSFLVPSAKRPIGGVMSMFEFANSLARRGHDVNLVHLPTIKGHIETIDDLGWFEFEPDVHHQIMGGNTMGQFDPDALPRSDFIELSGLRFFTDDPFIGGPGTRAGLPFVFLQAWNIFPEAIDIGVLQTRCPKVCIAHWLVDVAREHGAPDGELVHVPYGIKHDKYRLTHPIGERPLQISMLYSVHALKGAADGIEALTEVRRRVPGVRIVLFGNQDPIHKLPDGFVYYKDPPQTLIVEEIYNRSRVFLAPSVLEGFGFCPVEAMACGSALVTTSNGGSDDYATDGVNALVVAPRDIAAMADRVEALLRDDGRRVELATRGMQSVAHFDWDTSGALLEAFLRRYAASPTTFGAAADTAANGAPRR